MGSLARAGRAIGVEWAKHTFSNLALRGRTIPREWPGTREEAAALVVTDDVDLFDLGQLALEVNLVARDTWSHLVTEFSPGHAP